MQERLDNDLAALDKACENLYNTILDIVKENAGFLRIQKSDSYACKVVFVDKTFDEVYEKQVSALGVFCNELCIMCEDIDGMDDGEVVNSDSWKSVKYSNLIKIVALKEIAMVLLINGY